MNTQRFNPCLPVRLALIAMGVSTVKVTHAVNAAIGNLHGETKKDAELGYSKVTKGSKKKAPTYSVTENLGSIVYKGKANVALTFDAFDSAVEKVHERFPFSGPVPIPDMFQTWLASAGFKAEPETTTEPATENAPTETPATAEPATVPAA